MPQLPKPSGSRRIPRIAAALMLAAMLGSCATPPGPAPADQTVWLARQAALAALTDWQVSGRIGVVSGQDGWHASFQWAQQDADYRIDLIGPLGQGRVVIQGDARETRVQTQDGRQWTAPDAEVLLERSLGVRLPVNGLRYWVRGLPEPGPTPTLQTDAEGRLTRLEQNGWIIEYPVYAPVAALDLPARIIARRPDLSIRLVIEQWSL